MEINPDDRKHIRFAVLATDIAIFTLKDDELCVRLMRVDRPPHFPNTKGLPGALILREETALQTAERVMEKRAKLRSKRVHMEQLYTFSDIDRDPRDRVVAVGYLALVPWESLSEQERTNTPDAWWAPVSRAKHLAYDHDEILAKAVSRLRARTHYTTLISKIMPKEFTLTELEHAYETILKRDIDKRNFRKKILKLGIIAASKGKRTGGRSRPAQLYHFTSQKVDTIEVL
ncbi:MAG TPA: NUDIX hydrolase [Candidatus Paceibacterota bacterium]|nr:NUDIX hydrolase [Candidatus Paceibacterota bacterium]